MSLCGYDDVDNVTVFRDMWMFWHINLHIIYDGGTLVEWQYVITKKGTGDYTVVFTWFSMYFI